MVRPSLPWTDDLTFKSSTLTMIKRYTKQSQQQHCWRYWTIKRTSAFVVRNTQLTSGLLYLQVWCVQKRTDKSNWLREAYKAFGERWFYKVYYILKKRLTSKIQQNNELSAVFSYHQSSPGWMKNSSMIKNTTRKHALRVCPASIIDAMKGSAKLPVKWDDVFSIHKLGVNGFDVCTWEYVISIGSRIVASRDFPHEGICQQSNFAPKAEEARQE